MTKQYPVVQIALCVFAAFALSSCASVSLTSNYLKTSRLDPSLTNVTIEQLVPLDTVRKKLDAEIDSSLHHIELKKREKRHLKADEINALYMNFGAQLNYDRIFNAVLNNKRRRNKITEVQRFAGAVLLQSAAKYNQTYQDKKNVRRALNRGDRANKIPHNILQKTQQFLYSPKVRKKLDVITATPSGVTDSLLSQLPPTNWWKSTYHKVYRNNDRISAFFYNIFPYAGNSLFGKVGKRIKNRSLQRHYATLLLNELQPFDIVLSRSEGHAMAYVIPGYFQHASIWLGDENPLKRKRLLRNIRKESNVRPKIQEKNMAEALRCGVILSDLQEYADSETFLILRHKNLNPDQKTTVAENAIKQLNKQYDFNFDIESPDMINCTELVYLAFPFVDWQVNYFLGRYTLFPDDLLKTALNNNQLEVVAILDKGKLTKLPAKGDLTGLVK